MKKNEILAYAFNADTQIWIDNLRQVIAGMASHQMKWSASPECQHLLNLGDQHCRNVTTLKEGKHSMERFLALFQNKYQIQEILQAIKN